MENVNKQLLNAAKALVSALNDAMPHMATGHDCTKQFQALIDGSQAIAAAEQTQQVARDVLTAALNELRDACSFAVSGDIGVKSADKVMAGVDIVPIVDRYLADNRDRDR